MIEVVSVSHEAIESSRIIRAFQDHVPGVFVRDYRDNGGWIAICRGYITTWDNSMATDKFSTALPAETLCNLPPGMVTRRSRYENKVLKRPGWETQMRQAARLLSPTQIRAIERSVGKPIFGGR